MFIKRTHLPIIQELRPVIESDGYRYIRWTDNMVDGAGELTWDHHKEPMSNCRRISVHGSSIRQRDDGLPYRVAKAATRVYISKEMGYTHIELMGITENITFDAGS